MKFAAVICLLFALLGLSMGLKDPVCGLPFAAEGFNGMACLAYKPRWSYKPAENACKSWVYGGCGGNDNHFHSQEVCEAKCKE